MPISKRNLRTCSNGHKFYKSSDCPTCPGCDAKEKPITGFLSLVSAPARRALESQKISTLKKLATYSEKELLALHGFGPATLPVLRKILKEAGLSLKK